MDLKRESVVFESVTFLDPVLTFTSANGFLSVKIDMSFFYHYEYDASYSGFLDDFAFFLFCFDLTYSTMYYCCK